MNQPLAGLGVLVTRPAHQAGTFINLLQQAGAKPFALPAIEIQALAISDELKQRLLPSSRYQIVVFISANAVQWGLPLLNKNTGQQIAAIGEGSARALAVQGWQVDLLADSGFTSEDLLALPALQTSEITGKHILIIRGEGGREFLGETLQTRGALVEYAEVYRRCQPQTDTQWLAPLWKKDIHVVCVTSNEALENLYHMLKPYRDQLLHTTLLVPGARAYQLAQDLGFTKIIQAASASDNNMLQRIIQWHNQPLTGTDMNDSDNPLDNELAPPKKKSSIWMWVWILVLILGSVAEASYLGWKFLTNRFAQQQDQITNLQSTLTNVQETLLSLDRKMTAAEEHTQTLQDMAQQALDLGNRRQKGWVLAEADYLMRIASHRLQISRDVNSAIAALTSADQSLHEIGDLSLFPVRQQIAKDLTALKSLHQVDIDGLVLTLNQMSDQVVNLPMKSIDDEIKGQLPDTATAETTTTSISDKIINTIKSIGDIKIHQRGVSPATTEQRHYRNERMLINHLTSARLAALRFDTTQFVYDINTAQQTLNKDYDVHDNRVSQMLKELTALSQIELAPALPDISASWRMLQSARNKLAETQK